MHSASATPLQEHPSSTLPHLATRAPCGSDGTSCGTFPVPSTGAQPFSQLPQDAELTPVISLLHLAPKMFVLLLP